MTLLAQMRLPVYQVLPSGLVDGHTEFFYNDIFVYALHRGVLIRWENWTEELYLLAEEDMAKNPIAVQCLIDLGIEGRLDMIWQYIRCRYGAFDKHPDVDEAGNAKHTEYLDCGIRGKCAYEGKLCSTIKAPYGIISWREIEVIKLVADGLLNKEIADQLNISVTTVPVHLQNIFRKTGMAHRGELIRFAIEHNLINCLPNPNNL